MSILVVGSVAFDTLKTHTVEADRVIGGAATHFALAASFFAEVKLVAVVGTDFTDRDRGTFEGRSIDLSGLKTAEGRTFRWGGEYSENLSQRTTLFTELNVFEKFKPIISEQFRDSELVFLANIHPDLQLDVLNQMHCPRLIGADTMNFWIERTPTELAQMLRRIDVLIINEEEVRQLSGEYSLPRAAAKLLHMGPKTLVVKRGEYGVLCFRENERFASVSYPLETVVDPTGAGDSFAGGLMGYLAATNSMSDEVMRQAIIFGSVMGSFCVEDIGTRRVQRLEQAEIFERYKEFKELTEFKGL